MCEKIKQKFLFVEHSEEIKQVVFSLVFKEKFPMRKFSSQFKCFPFVR